MTFLATILFESVCLEACSARSKWLITFECPWSICKTAAHLEEIRQQLRQDETLATSMQAQFLSKLRPKLGVFRNFDDDCEEGNGRV